MVLVLRPDAPGDVGTIPAVPTAVTGTRAHNPAIATVTFMVPRALPSHYSFRRRNGTRILDAGRTVGERVDTLVPVREVLGRRRAAL